MNNLINFLSAKEGCGPFSGSGIFRIVVELAMVLLFILTLYWFVKNQRKLKGGKR